MSKKKLLMAALEAKDEQVLRLQKELVDKDSLLDLYREYYHNLLLRLDSLDTTIQKKLGPREVGYHKVSGGKNRQ